MPAAAVIPAPVAYIKVAAVKKLVVGFLVWWARSAAARRCEYWLPACHPFGEWARAFICLRLSARECSSTIQIVYFEKIRVFKAGFHASEYISMG